jgi:hypothetical protein
MTTDNLMTTMRTEYQQNTTQQLTLTTQKLTYRTIIKPLKHAKQHHKNNKTDKTAAMHKQQTQQKKNGCKASINMYNTTYNFKHNNQQ